MISKILLGIDGSDPSMKAVKHVIELQKRFASKTVVFHSVLHHLTEIQPTFGYGGNANAIAYNLHEDYVNSGKKIISDAEALFKKNQLEVEARLVFDISPEDYIKKHVEEENFDLVVVGYHGTHSALGSALLGSVPNKVINHVLCDVLVVK
jgi:nucleotide-binding universal stress UspA family protein